jgi:hypothetical protein
VSGVFVFDDAEDRALASDRVSRYGAYVRQHRDLFAGWDDNPVTSDPAAFTRAAWLAGTSPIMSPAYVGVDAARVQSITLTGSEHDGSLIARMVVAASRPQALRQVARAGDFDDWARGWQPPDDWDLSRRPALLTSVEMQVSFPAGELYPPQDAPGGLTVSDAKASVHHLAALLDQQLRPVLRAIDAASKGGVW